MTPAEISHIVIAGMALIAVTLLTIVVHLNQDVAIAVIILLTGGTAATQVGANNVLKGLAAGLPLIPAATPVAATLESTAPVVESAG